MKYSQELTAEICKYLEAGNSQRDSVALAGISEETFYQWMKKPEFSESIKKAEKRCKARNIALIQRAGEKSWQAAAWYLERRYHDEFALKQINEHQGKDGDPVKIAVVAYGENDPLFQYSKEALASPSFGSNKFSTRGTSIETAYSS